MSLLAEKNTKVILEDRYPYSGIPTTSPPDHQTFSPLAHQVITLPHTDLNFSSSFMKDGVAHSGKDKHVNAGSEEEIFDNELYIKTTKKSVKIKIQFKSSELRNIQTVEKIISFSRPQVVEIKNEYDTGL